MDEQVFIRARAFAGGLFEGDSGGHDIWHTVRVHDLAVSICRREGGDMDTVRLAALLHDADDRKLFGDNGHANALRFMESENIPAEMRGRVVRIIDQVSFRGTDSVTPDTLEGMIVQDADRLDAIGAVGIARAFAYGGSRGRPMHVPGIGPEVGMDGESYARNEGTTVNHFHEKLLLLRDMMNTPTAKRMAAARHDYMVGFLEEFSAEWDGLRRSQQHEVVPVEVDYPVALHPAQLGGHGAAVHPQVVGHLLAVHPDEEVVGAGGAGLVRQEGAHLLPGGPLGQLLHPAVQVQGHGRHAPDQVQNQAVVELAGRGAHVGHAVHVQEHDLGGLRGHQAGVQAVRRAGVLGAHQPARAEVGDGGAVAPPVLPDLPHVARQDQPEAVGVVPAAEQEVVPHVPPGVGAQALQHGVHLAVLYALEEARVPDHGVPVPHMLQKQRSRYINHPLMESRHGDAVR